jgi:hypothetical protein
MKINLEKLVTHSLRKHAADQSIRQNPIPTLERGMKYRFQNAIPSHAIIAGFHLLGQQFYHKIQILNLLHSKWKWMRRTCRKTLIQGKLNGDCIH